MISNPVQKRALNELKKRNPNTDILVITSYIEYLDDVMLFHIFCHLSKPLDKQRFFRNMKDVITLYHNIIRTLPVETTQSIQLKKAPFFPTH